MGYFLGLFAFLVLLVLGVPIISVCMFICLLAFINSCFDVNVLSWELSGGILPVLKDYDFYKFAIVKTIRRKISSVKVCPGFDLSNNPMFWGVLSKHPSGEH